jgi:radical SAM protein with 4Fe4S-binding SPASM domain
MQLLDDDTPLLRDRRVHQVIREPAGDLADPERRDVFARLAAAHHTVKLHLTPACNLKCRNCYNDAAALGALQRAEIFGLLDQLKGRPARLDLLGGEPVLHPDLDEVVRYAREEVGLPGVFLYTNGTRIDAARAARLARAGCDTAIVSLHGPTAAIHERLTGSPGSFDATCRGIAALRDAGVRTYTFTVVGAANAERIAEMREFAGARGVGSIFFPYVPQREPDDLAIADDGLLRTALTQTIRHSYVYRSALLRCMAEGSKLCRAFTQTVTIFSDGTVTPCPFVALGIGNIRERPLYDLLVAAATDPRLAAFLADPAECRDCRIRRVCGGGCKAGCFTLHGALDRRDLNCRHGVFTTAVSVSALPEHLPYVY